MDPQSSSPSATPTSAPRPSNDVADVVLIGAGIMSATLASLIQELQPDWSITLLERLADPAEESSGPWNNAGTGHSALCELNYTPQKSDGTVDATKALAINEQFQVSRQYWSALVESGRIADPRAFIRPVAHMSFVPGEKGQRYLRARYEALAPHTLFRDVSYVDDPSEFERLLPLMSDGRDLSKPVALNVTPTGTDVNFGALTAELLAGASEHGLTVRYQQDVKHLDRDTDGTWRVRAVDTRTGQRRQINARFVFVGAGGRALPLLQHAGIPEIKGMAGFPIGGQFLVCTDPAIVNRHRAKVYGQAAVGAPPMSVPHLDLRVVDGKEALLFGPYAGWTPKFLKRGSWLDLFGSIRPHNLSSMIGVGLSDYDLAIYLVTELLKSPQDRIEALREYAPTGRLEDWSLIEAGQRVQMIRPGGKFGGSLEFGTAVIASGDGSIAGLLGASPGASTSVSAMLQVLERCFPQHWPSWQKTLQERLIPSLGTSLNDNPALAQELWDATQKSLRLGE